VAPFDLVIRCGEVIDGTGAPRRRADVAVADGRVVAIGDVDGSGRREIDADGHVVTPGFVDAHTHMDAQVFWDEAGTSSCWHGVTTAVMGNCGFTLAPARPDELELVVRNLERAEDISAAAMAEGIDWTWGSFGEYLDAVEATPKGLNYAASIGHSALRTWAMGERAFSDPATEDELRAMTRELSDALRVGAAGFTTSRSASHVTPDGDPVASRLAPWSEVVALVGVLARGRAGSFQLAPEQHRGDPEGAADFDRRLQELALTTGVPVVYGVIGGTGTELIDDTVAHGGRMMGLTHCRGVSEVQSFLTRLSFDRLAEWQEVRAQPIEAQLRLLRDPAVRARLVHAAHYGDYGTDNGPDLSRPNYDRLRVLLSPYRPNPTVRELADVRRVDPVEAMIDVALERDFDVFFMQSFSDENDDEMVATLRNPNTAMTFSDSGAHVGQIIDSSIQSHLLAYWVREREAICLEEAIRMITSRPAAVWGLRDRGVLREGVPADITVFDPATVGPCLPEVVFDLPGGARRLIQRAVGFHSVVVHGEVHMRDGEPTGARAGRLLRAGQRSEPSPSREQR
jgi:N-acyl-D-aspartate/D-glutamate deacylase